MSRCIPTARHRRAALLLVAAWALAACSTTAGPSGDEPATPLGASHQPVHGAGLPSSHVHAVGRDGTRAALLLATHDGLFRVIDGRFERVGPVVDLMGFTFTTGERYYASGHPGAGTELPQPVGLIESTDGGNSWNVLSRGGESDFHSMTQAGETIVAFDGVLRRTVDGRTWETASIPAAPRALSSDPTGNLLLATTERGLLASTDTGRSWEAAKGAPLLLLVAWADAETVVGVAPDGTVFLSRDATATWVLTGRTTPAPQAMSASVSTTGLEILIVTDQDVLSSRDGATFVRAK